jgi:hypothetical protein
VLLAVSLVSLFDHNLDGGDRGVRGAAITGALVVWFLALHAFLQYRGLREIINRAIENSMTTGVEGGAAVSESSP